MNQAEFFATIIMPKIKALKESNPKIEALDLWNDDHIPCVSATINNIRIEMWYVENKTFGMLEVADESKKAYDHVFKMLEQSIMMEFDLLRDHTTDDNKKLNVADFKDDYNLFKLIGLTAEEVANVEFE